MVGPLYIGEGNLRSRRAVEKLGAQLIERQPRTPAEGAPYPAVVYALTRAEWRPPGPPEKLKPAPSRATPPHSRASAS